ncbi:hypothetical protein AMTR_s00010p00138560 [Amborella trichopoda]|uniref:Aminotransferase-like plant mobile domain-containing protein n=1 Tax=Amborella trichopoda TaxID=13333 RepID=W1NF91_AMBTC|nr:hypothetical protein AMTR_s00010p00138560 [Amborella trichopoda]
MTPTLFDVYDILGLAVDGDLVTCRLIKDLRKFIEDNLGIVLDGNLASLRHTWLKMNFRELPPDATPFFEDIKGVNTYAWGATALAFLYRSLGKACAFKRRHFSGLATLMQCWSYEHIMHTRPILRSIPQNIPRAKRWEPPKKYHGNPKNLMPPIRQEIDNLQPNEVIWNPYFNPDKVISDDRQQAFQTAMCPTTLIFDDIVEPYMPDLICHQFGAKQGISKNPLVVNKIASWLSRHDRIMSDIQQDTANRLPSEEYKAWYNLVSHPLIHNVANSPKDILQPHIHEEEEVVPAHEPQYIMRPRGYEDQLIRLY